MSELLNESRNEIEEGIHGYDLEKDKMNVDPAETEQKPDYENGEKALGEALEKIKEILASVTGKIVGLKFVWSDHNPDSYGNGEAVELADDMHELQRIFDSHAKSYRKIDLYYDDEAVLVQDYRHEHGIINSEGKVMVGKHVIGSFHESIDENDKSDVGSFQYFIGGTPVLEGQFSVLSQMAKELSKKHEGYNLEHESDAQESFTVADNIRRIRISENMGGHDGLANGGHYGSYSELFGLWGDEAIQVNNEKPNAVHKSQTGNRLNWHEDIWEKGYSINESKLRPNDFIAIEHRNRGLVYNSSGGNIEVVKHRLPIGDNIPDSWQVVGGYINRNEHDYDMSKDWKFIRSRDNTVITFESAARELGLLKITHPYGNLWIDGDRPVAINAMPRWSSGRDNYSFDNKQILGDREYFNDKGFYVIN